MRTVVPALIGHQIQTADAHKSLVEELAIARDAAVSNAGSDTEVVLRAAIESALLFAIADLLQTPMFNLLGNGPLQAEDVDGAVVETDITIPIASPDVMAGWAKEHAASGFSCFKVKVGRNESLGGRVADVEAVEAIAAATAGLAHRRLRLDGNAGQSVDDAVFVADAASRVGLEVELIEQPTPPGDLRALAAVAEQTGLTVIADESVKDSRDLAALLAHAGPGKRLGANLKLVKHGGPLMATALGRDALAQGAPLMVGAMVETRVGLAAMLHVARALCAPDALPSLAIDLDTAILLQTDPFVGGYRQVGSRITLEAAGPRRRS